MNRLFTGLVGALAEAWQEVRIHRTRVLLSLVGVAVAVCSLTTVVALGGIMQQATTELSERQSGRPASVWLNAYRNDGQAVDTATLDAAWETATARYGISYASRNTSTQLPVDSPAGVVQVGTQGVDQPYGEMHRVRMLEGEWFSAETAAMLAPRVVVNEYFWNTLGRPDLAQHPTLSLGGFEGTVAVIVGVTPSPAWDTYPSMYMLADQLGAYRAADAVAGTGAGPVDPYAGSSAQYEMWLPPENWEELSDLVTRDVSSDLGEGTNVDVYRQDAAYYGNDSFAVVQLVVAGIAVLVLLLGALGLVNIALVTVKQRVREIGIRRSFGATAGRVFFAVMMESVVATVVAGVAGVAVAILIVQSPWVRDLIGQGLIEDFPPFPVDAAVLGLVAASAVGALAGLLPALVAVRVKVIDAIRY
ncbi:putative ABC transport system permease protein [Microbacterium sp. AG1240]|uniref:ABC transporter permease n=1 Tax=Microbacterium sp. AG1240 TaxID=2183992 RepID=UPI000EB3C204|nr:ABC transporter permease [Microbacterium sp. AG1240]RKT33264.1 putative ABC transport system permease protein [Microbacterium sp. AG1240]